MSDLAQAPALIDGLLPCPFCGEQPVSLAITEDDSFVRCYAIRCDHCKIEFSEEYKSQTIDQWNTRALAPAQAADVAALIARWQREANNFRTVAAEMFEHGDNEEGTLCDLEASRIDTCASELRALPPPHPPAGNAAVEALEETNKALHALKFAVEDSGKMNDRGYISLGIQVNNALDKSDAVLAALQAREAESGERWTEQDIAEAKAEAKELYDYFHSDKAVSSTHCNGVDSKGERQS